MEGAVRPLYLFNPCLKRRVAIAKQAPLINNCQVKYILLAKWRNYSIKYKALDPDGRKLDYRNINYLSGFEEQSFICCNDLNCFHNTNFKIVIIAFEKKGRD
jgi:hypothetical protein